MAITIAILPRRMDYNRLGRQTSRCISSNRWTSDSRMHQNSNTNLEFERHIHCLCGVMTSLNVGPVLGRELP